MGTCRGEDDNLTFANDPNNPDEFTSRWRCGTILYANDIDNLDWLVSCKEIDPVHESFL